MWVTVCESGHWQGWIHAADSPLCHCGRGQWGGGGTRVRLHYTSVAERGRSPIVSDNSTTVHINTCDGEQTSPSVAHTTARGCEAATDQKIRGSERKHEVMKRENVCESEDAQKKELHCYGTRHWRDIIMFLNNYLKHFVLLMFIS